MTKRVKYHVVYLKLEKLWWVKRGKKFLHDFSIKAEAVKQAVCEARQDVGDGLKAQVVIHDRDGVIQSERTYPRSSDPHPPNG